MEDDMRYILSVYPNEPLLTREQEVELTQLIRQGDEAARQRMIKANLRLVINMARKFRSHNPRLSLPDLVQDGIFGLLDAVNKFDPERGNKFSTCAHHWIYKSLQDSQRRQALIPLAGHAWQDLQTVGRWRAELVTELDREPTLAELSQFSGMPVKKLQTVLSYEQKLVSIDQSTSYEPKSPTLGDRLSDGDDVTESVAVEAVNRGQMHELLEELLDRLDDRERRVIILHHGLHGHRIHTLEEIGEEFGLTRERIRQIEVVAMRKLRFYAAGQAELLSA